MSSLKEKLLKHKEKKSSSGVGDSRVEDVTELLGQGTEDVSVLINQAKDDGRFITLPADCFIPDPNQPRKSFDEAGLIRLQQNIEEIGQLQPIVVRPKSDDGKYMIVAGERRWRAVSASKTVGTVDAVIVTSRADELLILRMQIHENDNREDVNALEGAAAIMRGVELCKTQGDNIDDKAAAKILGVSPSSISKSRAILNAPQEIKALSEENLMQDSDTLYELTKAHKKDAAATSAFINDIRSSDIQGNIRKAAQKLDAELKEKAEEAKTGSSKGSKSKKSAKSSKSKSVADMLPTIDNLTFGSEGENTIISFQVGKKSHSFVLSDEAYESLSSKFNLRS